jgi:glycine C-acetyltransferase
MNAPDGTVADQQTAQGVDLFDKCRSDGGSFGWFRQRDDTYFTRPMLEGEPGPRMQFQGRRVLQWAINNYLGLAGDPAVKAAAARALEEHGTYAPMGSRMLTGNTRAHVELERRLAAFLQKPAAVVFNYGYLGVIGTISSLVGPDDVIVMDRLCHASIVDGAVLASAGRRFRTFKHNDLDDLERLLKAVNRDRRSGAAARPGGGAAARPGGGAAARPGGGVLILTEGVYGMRGDLADLPGICSLKERYGARLYVDDAHGFGVMGEHGRGLGEHFGVQDRIDLYFGTFAKAFAAIGGVTAGAEEPVRWIQYNARTNVFAKSLPLLYVAVLMATLEQVERRSELRERMWAVARRLQSGLVELGFDIGDTRSPITPVYVPAGDQQTAMQMVRTLREEHGVFVSGVTYPVVPPGVIMFRMIPTASHTDADVDETLAAFRALRDAMRLDLSERPSLRNR